MKMGRSVTQGFLVAGSLLLAIGLLPGTAQAGIWFKTTVTVNCDEGKTIAWALKRGRWAQLKGEPFTVIVQGPCYENVTITQNDVIVRGDPIVGGTVIASDPTLDTISIQGAQRVVIDNLTVKGSNLRGIIGSQGASFTVENNSIIRENRDGVRVSRGSVGTIEESRIEDNGRDGVLLVGGTAFVTYNTIQSNGRVGVNVTNGGSANLQNNDILNNVRNGVQIGRATGRLMGGNTIQENGGAGIAVLQGVLFQFNELDTIKQNSNDGIFGFNNASLGIQKVDISLNGQNGINLVLNSALIISGNSEVSISANANNGIQAQWDSDLVLPSLPPIVSITGNGTGTFGGFGIFCADSESSFFGDISGVTGNNPPPMLEDVNCTDFNQAGVFPPPPPPPPASP